MSHLCDEPLYGLGIDETLHSLRHYFGTSMYLVSRDRRLVQETMGHNSPLTTAGYAAWSPEAAAAAVEAIADTARPAVFPLRTLTDATGTRVGVGR